MEHTEDNSIVFNLILTSFNEAQHSPYHPRIFLCISHFPPTAVDLILFYVFPAGREPKKSPVFMPPTHPIRPLRNSLRHNNCVENGCARGCR